MLPNYTTAATAFGEAAFISSLANSAYCSKLRMNLPASSAAFWSNISLLGHASLGKSNSEGTLGHVLGACKPKNGVVS